jgi:hypothetical protein
LTGKEKKLLKIPNSSYPDPWEQALGGDHRVYAEGVDATAAPHMGGSLGWLSTAGYSVAVADNDLQRVRFGSIDQDAGIGAARKVFHN